jgi:hypothetical protein
LGEQSARHPARTDERLASFELPGIVNVFVLCSIAASSFPPIGSVMLICSRACFLAIFFAFFLLKSALFAVGFAATAVPPTAAPAPAPRSPARGWAAPF